MNLRNHCYNLLAAAAVLITAWSVPQANARTYPKVTNVSPNPSATNEFYLTATNIVVTNIGGTNVHVLVYMDDPPGGGGTPPGLPCPMIQANVGTMIICHFKNSLTNNIEGVSIHWHGIELDNDSDGTAVTQDSILPGQSYIYRFVAPRAGLFWYHSHMLPGTTTFGGMYGPIVITDPNAETTLMNQNVLPPANYTFPLVMGDISITNGVPGKVVNGTNYSLNTLIQNCENYALGLSAAGQPFCNPAGTPGDIVLVNGYPPALAGTFCTPNINSTPVYSVASGQRVRLQLFNEASGRDFYLSLHYPCANVTADTNLYRVGGQGGLLDSALVDGGVQGGYDFKYKQGSIDLGTGMRADVMFYPTGNNGDVVQLVGNPLTGGSWNLSAGLPTNYPIAFFVITNTGVTNAPLAAGSHILLAAGLSNASLKLSYTNVLVGPPAASLGTNGGTIFLRNTLAANSATNVYAAAGSPTIDGYAAVALDGNSGDGSFPEVPHPPSALWARVGDVVQMAVVNDTGGGSQNSATHPFHLHGFSMQPMYIYSSDFVTNLYTFPYNEYLDTIEVYPGQAIVFRIKLTDRPVYADTGIGGPVTLSTDSPTGGALGRWLMHCHIFLHTTIGMISELNVLPNATTRLVSSSAGTNSVILPGQSGVIWTNTANAPWLHLTANFASGNGNATILFTYDANPGAPRVGTLNVNGETVTVTQAGATYVQAPGPVTPLATGLSGPTGIAADHFGNVYFCDGGHGALKSWNPTNNTVTTLASGFGNLQGLGLDALGNVYFADFNSTAIRMWSASTHLVTTLFTNTTAGVSGLAVDNSGNVYITVPSGPAVKEWTASTGVLSTFTTSGLTSPYGVAVDTAGGVYVADTGANAVEKLGLTFIIVGGHPILVPNWNVLVASNYLNSPWNLAVDDGANVYIADGYDNAIKRYTYAGGTVDTLVSSGLGDPTDVAVDSVGNVYISDFNNGAIKELPYAYVDATPRSETAESTQDTLPTVLMPNESLLPPFVPVSSAFWIGYDGSSNGIVSFGVGANLSGPRSGTLTVLGQPVTINQSGATAGVATTNLLVGPAAGSNTVTEFVIPSVALWSASTTTPWLHLQYTSGTGSGNVAFTYDANPGPTRTGTLTINTKAVTVTQAGSTYVQALGPVTTLVSNGLSLPFGVALDPAGNVYIADTYNSALKMWSVANNSVTVLGSSGLAAPFGVALDGAGNVYTGDFNNYAVEEWSAASSNISTLISLGTSSPAGVAVDSVSNVYVADPTDSAIKKWRAATSTFSTLVTNGLNGPYGVALDAANNVYIADSFNNAIKEWFPASATVTPLVTSGLNTPIGVAVDGSGNVYFSDFYNNAVKERIAVNQNVVTLLTNGVYEPGGMAVDGMQNVYFADTGSNTIIELPYAFVDPTPKTETPAAGSDVLPVVLPPAENLLAPFAPTTDQSWLNIGSVAGGTVHFSFSANTGISNRTAHINLLGESIAVTQTAVVTPPLLYNVTMLSNGVFQFGFTNFDVSATFSVLFSTNAALPLSNWTVIGTASNVAPNIMQFTDTHATNRTRFYRVRSP